MRAQVRKVQVRNSLSHYHVSLLLTDRNPADPSIPAVQVSNGQIVSLQRGGLKKYRTEDVKCHPFLIHVGKAELAEYSALAFSIEFCPGEVASSGNAKRTDNFNESPN